MDAIFLPVLSHFQNGNPWSASAGRLRYRVRPDPAAGTLSAEVWEGPWAYEYSEQEETRPFPLSEEGLKELSLWLEQWRQSVEGRPARTFEENIQRRDAVALLREGTRENPVVQEK